MFHHKQTTFGDSPFVEPPHMFKDSRPIEMVRYPLNVVLNVDLGLDLLTCTSCSSQVVIESTVGQKDINIGPYIKLIKDPKLVHFFLEPCF